MTLEEPFISAIIPTYNRERTISRAIESVLAQTLAPQEIILIDDGSSDKTCDIIEKYKDSRIMLIKHQQNLGASAARNTGISKARGQFVAMLDSDDCWMEYKLERQMDFMLSEQCYISCTGFEITYSDYSEDFKAAIREYPKILTQEHIAYGCYISPGSTLIASKEAFKTVGGYNTAYKRYEDWDLLLKFLKHGYKIGHLQQNLSKIYATNNYNCNDALAALTMIKKDHQSHMKNSDKDNSYINFISGLKFNRASTLLKKRHYIKGIGNLIGSFITKPINNWLFDKILIPRIKARFSSLK